MIEVKLPDLDSVRQRLAEIEAERLTVDADVIAEVERKRAALHADEYEKLTKFLKLYHVPKKRGPRKPKPPDAPYLPGVSPTPDPPAPEPTPLLDRLAEAEATETATAPATAGTPDPSPDPAGDVTGQPEATDDPVDNMAPDPIFPAPRHEETPARAGDGRGQHSGHSDRGGRRR